MSPLFDRSLCPFLWHNDAWPHRAIPYRTVPCRTLAVPCRAVPCTARHSTASRVHAMLCRVVSSLLSAGDGYSSALGAALLAEHPRYAALVAKHGAPVTVSAVDAGAGTMSSSVVKITLRSMAGSTSLHPPAAALARFACARCRLPQLHPHPSRPCGSSDRHHRHTPQTHTTDTHHRHTIDTHTTDMSPAPVECSAAPHACCRCRGCSPQTRARWSRCRSRSPTP